MNVSVRFPCRFFVAVILLLVFQQHHSAFAGASSSNYALTDDRWTGGGNQALNSSSYVIAESYINDAQTPSMSSTNYGVASPLGVGGSTISVIGSVTPGDLSRFFSDQNASYTVSAVDPDGDTLQYRAKQDGTVKAGPQSSSTLTWALSGSDLGRRALTLEVLDPDGTVIKNQAGYVYRRPVK